MPSTREIQKHQQRLDGFAQQRGDAAAGVRRAGGQRRPVAAGRADRGPQGTGALDRPIAGADRRVGERNRPALESELAAEAKQLGFDAGNGRTAGVVGKNSASLRRRPSCCGRAAGDVRKRKQRGRRRRGGRLARRADRSGVGRARRTRVGRRDGPRGQSRFAVPPPRADRRAARPIGPPSDGIGGTQPPVGRSPTAAGRRAGRTWARCSSSASC